MAVDVALPARKVSGPEKLLVPWINHHGLFTVSELRRIDPGRRELQSTEGRQLFSCLFSTSGCSQQCSPRRSENRNVQRLLRELSI